jgi:sugar phosphate isomerase/epimerase
LGLLPIHIGNQTSPNAPAHLPYAFARRHQFDAFEWFSDQDQGGWSEEDVSPGERARLREVSENEGMRFSVHAPCPADPTSNQGFEAIHRSIQFGGDVGAAVVNMHLFPEHGAEPFAESLVPLLEAARKAHLRLSLENTPETSPDYVNAVFEVLAAIPLAAGRVGLCLDMGHANLFADTRNDYMRFVDLLGEHVPIIHWHAHENWGDGDSHLTLFTGSAGHDDRGLRALIQSLQRRGFRGSAVLEQWPEPPEQLVHARDRLRGLWNDLQEAAGYSD